MAPDPADNHVTASAPEARVTLAIGMFDDGLVVMPLGEARRLAALNDALELSGTWGEFVRSISDDAATQTYLTHQLGEDLPDDDEPFDADEVVPGFAEGSWPTFPKQAMLDWLPQSVIDLGSIRTMTLDADYLHIAERLRSIVVRALATDGHDCREDTEDLVVRACGAWRYA